MHNDEPGLSGGSGGYVEGAVLEMERQVVQVLRAIGGLPVLEGDCDVIEEAIAHLSNTHQGATDDANVV